MSTGYLMESAEEYEIRKRLSEELAGLEEQAAASIPPVMEEQKSRGDWTVKSERSEEQLLAEEWLNTEEPPFIKERMESDGEAYVDDGTNADNQPYTDNQLLTESQSFNPAKSIIGALALLKSRHFTEASSNAEDQQSYENQTDDTNLLNNRGWRNSLDDIETDDNESYQPRSRKSEKQKPKEKTPKPKSPKKALRDEKQNRKVSEKSSRKRKPE